MHKSKLIMEIDPILEEYLLQEIPFQIQELAYVVDLTAY
jgi:hypothetical protein